MAELISEVNDITAINFVAGLSDPGEMIRCGYLPQLRRQQGEQDADYAKRIYPLVMALSQEDRDRIMGAAINRARLDTSTGKVAVFVAGKQPAWHAVGKHFASNLTKSEVLPAMEANFKIVLGEDYGRHPLTGEMILDPSKRKVFRDDTWAILGTVGTSTTPFQNQDGVDSLEDIVEEGLAMYASGGCLNGGKQVWILAEIPKRLWAKPGDETVPYILNYFSHDGSGSVNWLPTVRRVECNNTKNLAIKEGKGQNTFRVRHSQSMKGRVEEARKALGLIVVRLDSYEQQMQALAKVSMKETEVTDYFEQFYPTRLKPVAQEVNAEGGSLLDTILNGHGQTQAVVSELLEGHYAETERIAKKNKAILEVLLEIHENDSSRGTAWGAYNAITDRLEHSNGIRGKTAEEKANNHLDGQWFGAAAEMKERAFTAAMALVR